MTREEAAGVLKRLWDRFSEYDKYMWPEEKVEALTAIAALRRPEPDSDTGLMPCGCGGKAILFHQPDIEGPGSDGDRWAVFCEKTCGMGTSDMTSPEYAVETWNTGMGWKGGAE